MAKYLQLQIQKMLKKINETVPEGMNQMNAQAVATLSKPRDEKFDSAYAQDGKRS